MERQNPERNRTIQSEVFSFYAPRAIIIFCAISLISDSPELNALATLGFLSAMALERTCRR